MPDDFCRSALFVDFDNIFIGLNRQEPELARRFASEPARWVSWLQERLKVPEGSWLAQRRRILIRRCYLNPQVFWGWRPYFIRDAFETIDCPPLTRQGKTSADVHMVLDIVDCLSGGMPIDEFIIVSADADFTPVLLKLRKHDRRSIVLAIGPSSSSYMSASDLVIDQEAFLEFLAPAEPPPAAQLEEVAKTVRSIVLDDVAETVRETVSRSQKAVPLASLAAAVRARHPGLGAEWGGYRSFSGLLADLNLVGLERAHGGPGYLYDPQRHAPPTDAANHCDPFESEDAQLREVAKRVADLTDTPYLTPACYAELFSILAETINADGYHITHISRTVRDECQRRGLMVNRQSVNFVLQGIAYGGHRLGQSTEVPKVLANAFVRNVLNLCARNQVNLSAEEEKIVSSWIAAAGVSVSEPAEALVDADA